MILDTTFFLDLKRRDDAAFRKGEELFDAGVPQRVPVQVLFELYYGVGATQSDEELRKVQNVLMGYPPVEADERIARVAGQMLGAVERDASQTGERTGADEGDAYVAATARVLDEPVLTRNVEDFEAFESVEVESY